MASFCEIVVHDNVERLEPLFCEESRPKERLVRAFATIERFKSRLDEASAARFEVAKAVLHDGFAVLVSQQFFGLFDPVRTVAASRWQFGEFRRADVEGRARRRLEEFAALVPWDGSDGSIVQPARLEFALFPADPANREAMVDRFGLDGCACSPGMIRVELWPSEGNLARFEALLARLFVLQLRWANWREPGREELAPAASGTAAVSWSPTLADHLAAQGLASNFVAALFPELPTTAWLAPFRPFGPSGSAEEPGTWEAELARVAMLLGVANYSELVTNHFGRGPIVGTARPAAIAPRDGEERDYARVLLTPLLAATDPCTIAAALYGDELVSAQGHAPLGLATYAGLEWAHERVKQTLAARRKSRASGAIGVSGVMAAIAAPSAELVGGS